MSAARFDIYVEQGATFRKQFTVRYKNGLPIDLSAYTPRMHIRPYVEGPLTLSVIGATFFPANDLVNGRFVLKIGADQTALIAAGRYRYDLELYNASDATDILRLLEGQVNISAEITT